MKSIKVRLEFNNKQITLAKKHAGVARFAYNWGLQKSQEAIEKKEKRPTAIDLHKLWVSEIKSKNEWTYEVSKCAPQQSFRNKALSLKKTANRKKVTRDRKIYFPFVMQQTDS